MTEKEEALETLERLRRQVEMAVEMVKNAPLYPCTGVNGVKFESGDYDFSIGDFLILDRIKRERDYPIKCTIYKSQ